MKIKKKIDEKEKDCKDNRHRYYESNIGDKNENSMDFKYNIVRLVTDHKEYGYITILKGLKFSKSHDYSYVSKYRHVIVEPHQSIPLLFKYFIF